ncbi:MAG: hypothetical protein K1X74_09720 [Pirellulales bacterium]|nr:hypothetical protein [Pirellulales bacterium]
MSGKERNLWRIRTLVSSGGLLIAIIGAFKAYGSPTSEFWRMLNAIVWTFGPPIWFIVEYSYLYPWLDGNPAHKEDLKHGQGLAAAFWAGIGVLLLTIYQTQSPQTEVDELKQIQTQIQEIRREMSASLQRPRVAQQQAEPAHAPEPATGSATDEKLAPLAR